MRKDKLKSDAFCPDCAGAEENAELETNDMNECCSCCCSCSNTGSEDESSNAFVVDLNQQKKDLLSNLTILRTNSEPASIQHVLQFVEALTHSSDFLRQYNLLEDFCIECLLSEPTCTCCTNDISQSSLNDQSSCSCDEDSHYQRYTLEECPDCASLTKEPNAVRRRSINRRRRRRRNRPRISTTNSSLSLPNSQNPNSSTAGEDRSQRRRNQATTIRHCEECARENASKPEFHENLSKECAKENIPFSCCEIKSQKIGNSSRDNLLEYTCECCCNSANANSKDTSNRPECHLRKMCPDQSVECSCDESSDCSDESCDE